jgi:hypothetical protein
MTATDHMAVSRRGRLRCLLASSTLLLNLTVHHNDRLLHERTKGFLVVVDGKDFCLGDDQRTAGADDLASGDQPLPVGRRNEIQFVLDGQDRGVGWHHCHRRVTGGRIGNGPDDATMHKAMLLLNAFPVGKMDFDAAVLNDAHRSPDQVHHILPVETLTNTLCEMRVGNVSHTLLALQLRLVGADCSRTTTRYISRLYVSKVIGFRPFASVDSRRLE